MANIKKSRLKKFMTKKGKERSVPIPKLTDAAIVRAMKKASRLEQLPADTEDLSKTLEPVM